MCGRYTLTNKTKVKEKFNIKSNPNYNISPQTDVLVINEKEMLCFINWSYNPRWAKKPMNLINARSETLRDKPSFKDALRCIFVADGWFEWQRNKNMKIPYYHHKKDDLIYFAGIYNKTSGCAIVTREAHQNIVFVHHRQPVLLEQQDFFQWLNGEDVFASISTRHIKCYPISNKVNNPKNNNPDNLTALQNKK